MLCIGIQLQWDINHKKVHTSIFLIAVTNSCRLRDVTVDVLVRIIVACDVTQCYFLLSGGFVCFCFLPNKEKMQDIATACIETFVGCEYTIHQQRYVTQQTRLVMWMKFIELLSYVCV